MKIFRTLAAVAAVASLSMLTSTVPAGATPSPEAEVAPDVTAAFAVFDRKTGRTTLSYNEHKQFRSASIVKILIALDYLETRGPDAEIPEADLVRLVPMLRSSDDNAASELWVQEGWEKIVERMVVKLGLDDTEPPVNVGFWGYTALSAADVVKIYRYVLDEAHPKFRDFIMGNLHEATTCATDGFDQSFGIPSAVPGEVAFKQGWSRFGDVPPRPCVEPQRPRTDIGAAEDGPVTRAEAADLDLTSPAMHTTGTYGPRDRKIMVVLTLEPEGTTWDVSADRITLLTKLVYLADRHIRS
ncbi:class A beta-lactamase-related serine hydrolase [Saccharothrix sp. ALI-22-I]|uniref:class A beta-lactamase-related serine hydrolase n=1 Tax=Saccharothrix sp. ALI-22-I TaxID=1933778 RepID=UPI001EE6C4C8|nr:class A beta-lactamase-related serine hydrolase [Saccharothrix sp. ALI-22-I]